MVAMYAPNPGMYQMWAASDANVPGSGQRLEAWALGEIQKATQDGSLDPNDPAALNAFLGSLGITPEKGGGRFLYNKLTGPGSPLSGLKATAATRGIGTETPGMGSPFGGPSTPTAPGGIGPRVSPYGSSPAQTPDVLGRSELQTRMKEFGPNPTLGPLANPKGSFGDFEADNWNVWR